MKIFIRPVVIAIICSVLSYFFTMQEGYVSQVVAVITSTIVSLSISSLYELVDTHGQSFSTWWKTQKSLRDKWIRLSFSYLYRIEIDGKYLLVRGNRLKNQFQPVGGVYKFYDEAKDFLNGIHYVPDTKMKNGDEINDLRIQIQGKEFLKFMDWFLSMKNREYDPIREFREELIETKLLDEQHFSKLQYRKVDVHNKGVTFSPYLQVNEILYADIFELKLNELQKDMIREAVHNHPDDLCLASPEEIIKLTYGDSVESNLGNNTPWIIGEDNK